MWFWLKLRLLFSNMLLLLLLSSSALSPAEEYDFNYRILWCVGSLQSDWKLRDDDAKNKQTRIFHEIVIWCRRTFDERFLFIYDIEYKPLMIVTHQPPPSYNDAKSIYALMFFSVFLVNNKLVLYNTL